MQPNFFAVTKLKITNKTMIKWSDEIKFLNYCLFSLRIFTFIIFVSGLIRFNIDIINSEYIIN